MNWHCNKCWPMDCNCRLIIENSIISTSSILSAVILYTFSGETI